MKTRVRPSDSRLGHWLVDAWNPHRDVSYGESWVNVGQYHFFWYANWRANKLAKGSLAERFNVKERFINRLKFGDDNG